MAYAAERDPQNADRVPPGVGRDPHARKGAAPGMERVPHPAHREEGSG
jgi:hypothetical protein